jgi:hypothetical protein
MQPTQGGGTERAFEGCLANGHFDGPFRELYESGAVATAGTLRDGRRDGSWIFWDERGRARAIWQYDGGLLVRVQAGPAYSLLPRDDGTCTTLIRRLDALTAPAPSSKHQQTGVDVLLKTAAAQASARMLTDCQTGRWSPVQRHCLANALDGQATTKCLSDPPPPTPSEIAHQLEGFAADICACGDAACVHEVETRQYALAAHAAAIEATKAEAARTARASAQKRACVERISSHR